MEFDNQLMIGNGEPPTRVQFLTDDDLAARLTQIENGLLHLQAVIPAMVREVECVRGQLRRAA